MKNAGWVLLAGALLIVVGLVHHLLGVPSSTPATDAARPTPVGSMSPVPGSSAPSPAVVLQLPGSLPTSGPRSFVISKESGPVLGSGGTLRRFRVAVESNLVGELDEFGKIFEETLGDKRSWIGGGKVRFQRVAAGQPYDFTIYLVTRQTAYQMCKVNGVDIREKGVPYTSCRQVRQVIINLDRWRLSVPEYVSGGIPLLRYRQYLVNHEVGHELGRFHELCPGKGRLAPTMLTQTLSLKGCIANPWPYVNGKRYAGPAA